MKRYRHIGTGVTGEFVREYKVTGSCWTLMIRTDDGRMFYAPSHEFMKLK